MRAEKKRKKKSTIIGKMYLYLQPHGGFNDILSVIDRTLEYCKRFQRILIIDMVHSEYNIHCSDYFDFPDNVLCDMHTLYEICNKPHTVYPECLNSSMLDILQGNLHFRYTPQGYVCKEHVCKLPDTERPETILVHSACGTGNGYALFRRIVLKPNIRIVCAQRYKLLQTPYLAIQVRNTDYTSDYKKLYEDNRDRIHSYASMYVATDDIHVLDYYRSKGLCIMNFATFPEGPYKNLHGSKLDGNTKIMDLLADIYILAMADTLLSNSKGGFIQLVRTCFENKDHVREQFYEKIEPIVSEIDS